MQLQQCWTDSAWPLPLCCSAKQAGKSCCQPVKGRLQHRPVLQRAGRPSTVCPVLLQLFSGFSISAWSLPWCCSAKQACLSHKPGEAVLDRQCLLSSPVLLCQTGCAKLFVTAVYICFRTSLDRETTVAAVLQCLVAFPVLLCKSNFCQAVVSLFCRAAQGRDTLSVQHCCNSLL